MQGMTVAAMPQLGQYFFVLKESLKERQNPEARVIFSTTAKKLNDYMLNEGLNFARPKGNIFDRFVWWLEGTYPIPLLKVSELREVNEGLLEILAKVELSDDEKKSIKRLSKITRITINALEVHLLASKVSEYNPYERLRSLEADLLSENSILKSREKSYWQKILMSTVGLRDSMELLLDLEGISKETKNKINFLCDLIQIVTTNPINYEKATLLHQLYREYNSHFDQDKKIRFEYYEILFSLLRKKVLN